MSPQAHVADLFRLAQRAASEAVGAAKLYTHLRDTTGFNDQVKALHFLSGLEAAATKAKEAWEVACAPATARTPEQQQTIIRLLNDVRIGSHEKNAGLLQLPRLTVTTAADMIQALQRSINASAGYTVYPEAVLLPAPPYTVVGEAWVVERCDCGTDGCSLCEAGFVRKELTVAA